MYPEKFVERPNRAHFSASNIEYSVIFHTYKWSAANSSHTFSRKAFDLRPAERIASSFDRNHDRISIHALLLTPVCEGNKWNDFAMTPLKTQLPL